MIQLKIVTICFLASWLLGSALSQQAKEDDRHIPDVDKITKSSDAKADTPSTETGHENTSEEHTNFDQDEDEENKNDPDEQKRMRIGSLLGKGFTFGKRFGSVLGHGYSFGKRFGSILGHGLNLGKRYGYVLGHGFNFGKRKFDHDKLIGNSEKPGLNVESEDDINVRTADDDNIEDDIEYVDLDGPVDDKRWVMGDIFGGGFPSHKRSRRDVRKKRYIHYFGNMLGRGFSLGKRNMGSDFEDYPTDEDIMYSNDDSVGDVDKRFYSGMLGRGYLFGKREGGTTNDKRRYYGSLLGRGFAFGKRDGGMDNLSDDNLKEILDNIDHDVEDDEQQYYDDNDDDGPERQGYEEKLQNRDEDQTFHDNKDFHGSPGHRLLFRKGQPDKRYGFVLGRGFSFGKRSMANRHDLKRPFGNVLGHGLSFGKRSSEYFDDVPPVDRAYFDEDPFESNKRAGYLLGKGYMFGKRGSKRFGWVLGQGFRFGKRSDVLNSNDDIDLFMDRDGDVYIRVDAIGFSETPERDASFFGCDGPLVKKYLGQLRDKENDEQVPIDRSDNMHESKHGEVRYFIDDDGFVYVRIDNLPDQVEVDLLDDDMVLVCAGDVFDIKPGDEEEIPVNADKRGFGQVLGRGFRFGKREGFPRWGQRFGHVLGHGFSMGK